MQNALEARMQRQAETMSGEKPEAVINGVQRVVYNGRSIVYNCISTKPMIISFHQEKVSVQMVALKCFVGKGN